MPKPSDKVPLLIMLSRQDVARLHNLARENDDESPEVIARDFIVLGLDEADGPVEGELAPVEVPAFLPARGCGCVARAPPGAFARPPFDPGRETTSVIGGLATGAGFALLALALIV